MKRRNFIKNTSAIIGASQSILIPSRSEAIVPALLDITLGLISAGGLILAYKSQAEITAKSNKEIHNLNVALEAMKHEFEMRRLRLQYGMQTVTEEVTFERNGRPVKRSISKNIDGYGTELGLNGRYGTARGNYGGTFSTVEAAMFAGAALQKEKTMPVPVDGYKYLSPNEGAIVADYFNSINKNDFFPIAKREFSSALDPTKAGWDLATILYANNQSKVNAVIFPRKFLESA